MDLRVSLQTRIDRNLAAIDSLRHQIGRIEGVVEGLREAMGLLPEDGSVSQTRTRRPQSQSNIQRTREFLLQAGEPLHIGDILRGLGKDDNRANRASLVGSLARYARRGKLFQRHGPNEFSAIDEGQPNQPSGGDVGEAVEDAEFNGIPPSFGRDVD